MPNQHVNSSTSSLLLGKCTFSLFRLHAFSGQTQLMLLMRSNEKKHPESKKRDDAALLLIPYFCEHGITRFLLIIFTPMVANSQVLFLCVRNNNVTNFNIFVNNSPHTRTHMSKLLKKARLTLSSEHSCASASTKKNSNCGLVQWKSSFSVDVRVFIICLGSRAKQKNPPRRAKGLEEQGALI
jgi:hypothetical protein